MNLLAFQENGGGGMEVSQTSVVAQYPARMFESVRYAAICRQTIYLKD